MLPRASALLRVALRGGTAWAGPGLVLSDTVTEELQGLSIHHCLWRSFNCGGVAHLPYSAPLWEWGLVSDAGPGSSGSQKCACFCSEGKVTAKTSFQREFRVAREDLHSPWGWLLMDTRTLGPCPPTWGALVTGDRAGGIRRQFISWCRGAARAVGERCCRDFPP